MKICEYCTEYMKGIPCDDKKNCYLYKLYKENKRLKEENKRLKCKIEDLQWKMSYMDDPFSIGDRHEMGG